MNEYLTCEREPGNVHDNTAVKIMKGAAIVGHMTQDIYSWITYGLMAACKLSLKVTGPPQNRRRNGIQVPVMYHLRGPIEQIEHIESLINDYLERIGNI